MSQIHFIYHAGCVDGLTSLWVATLKYGKENIIPYEGSREAPPEELPDYADVIIADFSFSREQVEELAERSNSLRIFDHHETAREALEDLPCAVFDMKRSGASITWDELIGSLPVSENGTIPIVVDGVVQFVPANPKTGRPWFVDYVEDRDLWRFDLEGSAEVGAFIQTLEHDLKVLDAASLLTPAEMIEKGTGALAMRQSFVRQVLGSSFMCEMGGRVFPMVNVNYPMGSETAQGLMEHHGTDMAGYFLHRSDDKVQYGFRSRNGVTVHDFARRFGGGGHAQASGCMGESIMHRNLDALTTSTV